MQKTKLPVKNEFLKKDFEELQEYTTNLARTNPSSKFSAYSLNRIEELEENAEKIAKKEGINTEVLQVAKAIIRFYSLPHVTDMFEEEEEHLGTVEEYLTEKGFNDTIKKEIQTGLKNIHNYSMHFSEAISLAQDAMTIYYGEKGLKSRLKNEFKEYDMATVENLDIIKWIEKYTDRIKKHRYHFKWTRKKCRKRKIKNLEKLHMYTYKLKREASLTYNKRAMTMFKTASRNQVDLVNIADKKAGIMITVNSILLTIMLPLFASYIVDMGIYMIPAVILVITCGITIILATMATKPVDKDKPTKKDFQKGDRSLFYFRNFNTLDKEEYKRAVQELIVRDGPFENAVITDLFDLGQTLGVKYQRLKWCYLIFAIGIGLTLISLLASVFFLGY